MENCRSPYYKKLLYAYELGLLEEDQRRELELHILECDSCQKELKQFEPTISIMRSNPHVRDAVSKVVGNKFDEKASLKVESKKPVVRGNRRFYTIGVLAAAAIFIFLILKPWNIEFQLTKEAIATENRIAVMPFENLVDELDSENLGRILTYLLIADLSESEYLQAVSSQHIYDIIKLLGDGKTVSINKNMADRIADKSNARWMLLGRIIQTTPRLVITIELVDVSSGDVVMSRQLEAGTNEDIFAMVDRLTVEIKNNLSLPAAAWKELDPAVADVTTHSHDAYKAYLEGLIYYDKLYLDKAYEYYRKALEYDSTFATAYYCLAWTGDPEMMAKAIKYSQRATRKEQLYIKSLEARKAGDEELAEQYLLELIEKYPDEKMALFELAIFMEHKNNYPEAINYFKKSLIVDPLYKMAYNYMVYAYSKMGYLDSAMTIAEKYIEIAPDEPNPYDTYGEFLAKQGNLDRAIEMYKKACSIKADFFHYSSLLVLGRLYVYKHDYSKASELFQEAAANGGNDVRAKARTFLALVPVYQGQLAKGLEILNDGIAADRMDRSDKCEYGLIKYNIKAQILSEMGRVDEARFELEKAIKIQGAFYADTGVNFAPVYLSLLVKQGDTTRARMVVEELEQTISGEKDASRQAYWRSMTQYEFFKGDYKKSIGWLEKQIDDGIVSCADNLYLGLDYIKLEEFEKAAAVFEKQQKDYFIDSRLTNALLTVKADYYLGLAYENMNLPDKAINQYTKFISILDRADIDISEVKDAYERLLFLKQGS
ncbi:MAG: tetratricopeptide repeat protein [Candidatus Zixiibacteriota bacterium]